MKIQPIVLTAALLAGVGVLGASSARADIDPGSVVPTITVDGSDYLYSYPIDVENSETVVSGDFFTFFDVQGLVANSEFAPADWTATSSLVGPTAAGTASTSQPNVDDPTIPNVTFTYTGSTPITGFQDLGDFGFESIYPTGTTPEGFTAVAELTGSSPTLTNSNATFYFGPTATVPEANTASLLGLGSIGLLGMLLRARKTRNLRA